MIVPCALNLKVEQMNWAHDPYKQRMSYCSSHHHHAGLYYKFHSLAQKPKEKCHVKIIYENESTGSNRIIRRKLVSYFFR